jgi:hypothetical protein
MGRPVVLAAGVAGGDRRVRVHAQADRPQGGQAFQRGVRPGVLVGIDQRGRGVAPARHRDELVVEAPLARRGGVQLLGPEG